MESSSSRGPDEEQLELHDKTMGDLLELRLAGGEEDCKEEEENKDKAKKKRIYTMSQEHAEMLLSYKLKPLPEHKTIDRLAEEDEDTFGDFRTAIMGLHGIWRDYENIVLAGQEKIKHDLETKGCVTYEATHEIAYMVALATKGCISYVATHDIADDDEDAAPAAA